MHSENEMTAADFLSSLRNTQWYIKKNNQRYELRVANGELDAPFIDKNGELFGIKGARINFYIFEKGTNNPAKWAPKYLHDIYTEYDLQNPETIKELEETGFISWNLTLSYAFILYLLKKGDFVITDTDGRREETPPASRVY